MALTLQSLRTVAGCTKLLRLAAIVLAVVLLITMVGYHHRYSRRRQAVLQSDAAGSDIAAFLKRSAAFTPVQADISRYLAPAQERDIFAFATTDAAPAVPVYAGEVGFKLVGISFVDYPEAIIENTQENRVYVAKEGDRFGELAVKKIYADYVVVEYQNEELTLQ